jgi:hypothetical protein
MPNKFLKNPLERIFAICLTILLFVHCCLVENSYNSCLEGFNYKIYKHLDIQTLHTTEYHAQ